MGKQSMFGRTIGACVGALLLFTVVGLVGPATPAGAATALTVTPSTGLVDLDTVTITGTGFAPNSVVGVCEGITTGTTIDSCGVILFSSISGSSGDISLTAQVHQVMWIPALGRNVDCRVEACAVAAANIVGVTPDPATIVRVPISFAPAPPPPATRGTISVTPDGDLVDFQSVQVVGSGFRPASVVELLVCGTSTPVDQGLCSLRQTVTADATGAFAVESSVTWSLPGGVDCRTAPGTCTFVAGETVDVAGTLVSHPLSFQQPSNFFGGIDAAPYADLVDGQTITVDGHIFDPNTTVSICEVTYPFERTDNCESNVLTVTSDASGAFTTTYTVHRTITVGGVEVDCRVTQCQIGAEEPSQGPGSFAGTSIYFRVPRPTVVPGVTTTPPAEGDSGTTTVEVPVHLSEPTPLTVTVPWSTIFVPGAPAGQADPASDYVAASGVATFLPGQTDLTVSIVVHGDTLVEPDEYIVVSFNHATNAYMGGYWGLGFGIIGNDDP